MSNNKGSYVVHCPIKSCKSHDLDELYNYNDEYKGRHVRYVGYECPMCGCQFEREYSGGLF